MYGTQISKTHQQFIYMWQKGCYTRPLSVLNPKPKPASRIHEEIKLPGKKLVSL